jgi:hypothetical protein
MAIPRHPDLWHSHTTLLIDLLASFAFLLCNLHSLCCNTLVAEMNFC